MPGEFDTAFESAVVARLAASSTLVGLLSTLQGAPAITTDDPVPAGMRFPFVQARGPISGDAFDTKDRNGIEFRYDVGCYCDRAAGDRLAKQLARLVRDQLHRYRAFSISGFDCMIADAGGNMKAPTDVTVAGIIVPIRWVFRSQT